MKNKLKILNAIFILFWGYFFFIFFYMKQNENAFKIVFLLSLFFVIGYFFYQEKKWYMKIYKDPITKGDSYAKFEDNYNKLKGLKALIVMDIGNFGLLNKYYGYEFCNELLNKIYIILENSVNKRGFCARKIDDRFFICFSYHQKKEIENLVNKIDSTLKKELNISLGISFTYGICECHNDSLIHAELKTVMAWKNAKKSSNDFYAFYEEDKINDLLKNKILLVKLENALNNDKLDIYFQAKYDVKNKKIIGSEALLRWKDENGNFISPQTFIPSAEETGFITKIDSYVLHKVCAIVSKLKEDGLNPGTVSINVSRNKLSEESVITEYAKTFEKYKLSKKEIELEITEGTVLSEDQKVHKAIQELIKENFSILIDDFGTGYSSISMLKNLRMKGIKIDRSFVIDETKKGKEILKYVVTLAKGLNLETIAEGVEKESQYKYLSELGCDGIQGYYFSKPMPLDEYKELLKRQ